MNFIKLHEPEHIYRHIKTGREYPSVSKCIGHFKEKFDGEYWSKFKAYQDLVPMWPTIAKKYKEGDHAVFVELHKHIHNELLFDATVKNYLFTWNKKNKKARDKGTDFHVKEERKDIKRGYAINPIDNKPYKVYTNDTIDFNNLRPGCYVEIALCTQHINEYDENVPALCGTADKLFLCPDPTYSFLYCDMFDYKTNDDILKTAYKGKTFIKPFNKIEDNKVNGYTLQQSIYLNMLKKYGVVPRNSFLLIAPDYNAETMGQLKLPYWEKDAERMVKEFLK